MLIHRNTVVLQNKFLSVVNIHVFGVCCCVGECSLCHCVIGSDQLIFSCRIFCCMELSVTLKEGKCPRA